MDIIIKSAYSVKSRYQIFFEGEGRTKQSFKDDTDINNIMARFIKTGTLDFTNKNEPRYADVSGFDYMTMRNIVASANSMFAELPAHLRNFFNNNPEEFLNFVQDDTNRAKAEELGLLKPQAAAAPVEAAGVEATPPARAQARSGGRQAAEKSADKAPAKAPEGGKTISDT